MLSTKRRRYPMQECTWGTVQSLSPTTVRFAGDNADSPIDSKDTALTLAVGDRVALIKLGVRDSWLIVAKIGATT